MELLTPGTGLIFWQVIVWIILIVFLAKFAWKPIIGSLKIREDSIKEAIESAEQAKEEMAKLKSENEKLLQEARLDRDEMLKQARESGNVIIEEAKVAATTISAKMIKDAKATIYTEKQAVLTEVKNQVAMLSLEIAEKLVKKQLNNDKEQKEVVADFVKGINLN